MIQEYFTLALNLMLLGSNQTTSNLYLQKFAVPQIELYNLLANTVPQVSMPTTIGQELVLDEIEGKSEISIIDIGMGTGQQVFKLLHKLNDRGIKRVNIVGIEPLKDSLDQAEKKLKEAQFPFELNFTGINSLLENMKDEDLEKISQIAPNPVVWASFAFHHVYSDRTKELTRIKNILKPSLIVLLEPNVDHFTADFGQRFFNCLNHFKMTFDSIDLLGLNDDQTSSLKQFFGREIFDIISTDESKRTEKHEPATSWVKRLEDAGFSIISPNRQYYNDIIQIVNTPTYVSLEFRDFPLTSVIAAKSDNQCIIDE